MNWAGLARPALSVQPALELLSGPIVFAGDDSLQIRLSIEYSQEGDPREIISPNLGVRSQGSEPI